MTLHDRIWDWHREPVEDARFINTLMGRSPVQFISNRLHNRIIRQLEAAGIDVDESKGYDWPRRSKMLGSVNNFFSDIDTWWTTRDWFDFRKHPRLPL
jgi:hypothetical protein